MIVVVGATPAWDPDNPPASNPGRGQLTSQSIVDQALRQGVSVWGVDHMVLNGSLRQVTGLTGGRIVELKRTYPFSLSALADPACESEETWTEEECGNADGVATAGAIMEAVEEELNNPLAWIQGPYVSPVGDAVSFNAAGSHAAEGDIVLYEWDFDGDGEFDQETADPFADHVYDELFDGVTVLRVTDADGRTGIGATEVLVTVDGDDIPDEEDNCPAVYNWDQTDSDADGLGDECDATPGHPYSGGLAEGTIYLVGDDVAAWEAANPAPVPGDGSGDGAGSQAQLPATGAGAPWWISATSAALLAVGVMLTAQARRRGRRGEVARDGSH
jgi:hypothetical protein